MADEESNRKRKRDDKNKYILEGNRKQKQYFIPDVGYVLKSKFYNLRRAALQKNEEELAEAASRAATSNCVQELLPKINNDSLLPSVQPDDVMVSDASILLYDGDDDDIVNPDNNNDDVLSEADDEADHTSSPLAQSPLRLRNNYHLDNDDSAEENVKIITI